MTTQVLNIAEIKEKYPEQGLLIGMPIFDETELNDLADEPILQSKDKKEVCYLGREAAKKISSYIVIYTGQRSSARRLVNF